MTKPSKATPVPLGHLGYVPRGQYYGNDRRATARGFDTEANKRLTEVMQLDRHVVAGMLVAAELRVARLEAETAARPLHEPVVYDPDTDQLLELLENAWSLGAATALERPTGATVRVPTRLARGLPTRVMMLAHAAFAGGVRAMGRAVHIDDAWRARK